MKITIESLNQDWLELEIVADGYSLPILEIGVLSKPGPKSYLMMNKSQMEQLIQSLQNMLPEM